MRKAFRSIDEVLGSDLVKNLKPSTARGLDRVLKATRLEDKIYSELRKDDEVLDEIETECSRKLSTFPALSRDIFESFYALSVRHNDESELSDTAKQFNRSILDTVMNGEEYPTIKSVCEGRRLPAYDAAFEFVGNISDGLDDLLTKAGGDKGALNTLEKLAEQEKKLTDELDELLAKHGRQPSPELEKQIVDKAGAAASKAQQTRAVGQQVRDNLLRNQDAIADIIASATAAAKDKAEETACALAAWGVGDSNTSPEQMKLNREIVNRVRGSDTLREVAKYLGRFREMIAKARKNGYAYGRGEKYTIEYGNDLSRVLTSEFSMLAIPEAIPLFLRKYQRKRLQQLRRREPIFKGCGDIVMCLDESSSTIEDAPWGKAVALALLDAAMAGGRKFALIHFADAEKYQTDVFLPGQYETSDVFAAAETFLGGNTDFVTPLSEAERLIKHDGFENADIVFVTDGVCALPDEFRQDFKRKQSEHGFTVTGVLMDITAPGMEFSFAPFCDDIYRTSVLSQESIVQSLIATRV